MGNIVRKFRPNDNWRIGEHESWFTDMAAEGLHIKKMGLLFAHFVKGEPKQTRYRIDVSIQKKLSPEQKQMYVESGWNYVTSYNFFNVFSSPVAANAPELHTDPAEQSFTLKELDKKFAWSAAMVVAATLLILAMTYALWFLDGTPVLAMVEGHVIQQTVITILILYSAFTSLQGAISIRALRKSLIEGKPINHHAPWRKRRKQNIGIGMIVVIVTLLGSALPFSQLVLNETQPLPTEITDLPIVRLAEIEQNPDLMREQSTYIRDWGNHYRYNWSLLAPVQYESDESGMVPNEMWKDGSGKYSPSIGVRFFQLRFPSLAEQLISDLIKRYSLAYQGGDFIEIEHNGFDNLIVHEVDEFKEVFAAKGKAVMYVRYYGYAEMESVIQSTANKVDLISE